MPGLSLGRNRAPAEDDDLPDDLKRDVLGWVRNWPRVEQAYEMFQETAKEYLETTRELNHKAGRKLNGRGLSNKESAALQNLLLRTGAVVDALNKKI